jgi:myo-inositol-1(or 4)-monophosphatase
MISPVISDDLLDELLALALDAAGGAAELLQEYAGTVLTEVSTKSSPTDLVSEADRASEDFIATLVRKSRPEDSVRGEEGTAVQGRSGISWVADPLDGTTNFLFGVPAYSVSLAACHEGRPVVGVVVDPSRQETWSAVVGRGAHRGQRPCHVAEGRSDVGTALVATGFGYQAERRAVQGAVLARILPRVRDVRRFGSAALDLCWVAGGRFDAFYESGLNDWDWAAGSLICEEAGATVTRLPAGVLMAATPSLSEPLGELITSAYAEVLKQSGQSRSIIV